jgi:hypothetical protein
MGLLRSNAPNRENSKEGTFMGWIISGVWLFFGCGAGIIATVLFL